MYGIIKYFVSICRAMPDAVWAAVEENGKTVGP